MIAGELLAERGIDFVEHGRRRRKGIGQGLAHADGLAALARKIRKATAIIFSGPCLDASVSEGRSALKSGPKNTVAAGSVNWHSFK